MKVKNPTFARHSQKEGKHIHFKFDMSKKRKYVKRVSNTTQWVAKLNRKNKKLFRCPHCEYIGNLTFYADFDFDTNTLEFTWVCRRCAVHIFDCEFPKETREYIDNYIHPELRDIYINSRIERIGDR